MTTPVIFRTFKDHTVLALLPTIPADYQGFFVTCFDLTCSHGSADYGAMIQNSRPSTEEEYKKTLDVMTRNYGYDLTVFCRRSSAMRNELSTDLLTIKK
jgi:hypothetical protein